MQLYGNLNILWHCSSLRQEWKLTSSPVTSAEFSKFAGILSVALSQHHLLGIKIAQLEILSPPLALFIVMFPKAHITSFSRMSGSRWVNTPPWLSGSLRLFFFNSLSVYSCHFLISSASIRSYSFYLYNAHPCMKCFLGISNFLEETSSLSHSIVFLYFFSLFT